MYGTWGKVPNKFIVSWERARGILKPFDPTSGLPYNAALVTQAMFPNTGSRDDDRTAITQYDFGLALDSPMSAAPTLAPGIVGSVAIPLALSLPTQPPELGADGLPPLYIARTDIISPNPGLSIITAISTALGLVQLQILAPPFFGAIPPDPVLVPLVQAAWLAQVPLANVVTLFDASVIRYIAAAFAGGEGSAGDPPSTGFASQTLTPRLSVVIDDAITREVTFTNDSTESTEDPGLAYVVKPGDNSAVSMGGPGSTLEFQYPPIPLGPVTFDASIVAGNIAGTVESSPTTPVFFLT